MVRCDIAYERDVMVPMRDGVGLASDVYVPSEGGPFPVLLHRMPYGKANRGSGEGLTLSPLDAVEHGYALVVQDVRGTGGSGGSYTGYWAERPDGHDTITWAAGQPWSNGRVGIYGSSYMGLTSTQAMVGAPAALQACVAYLAPVRLGENRIFGGGAFELGSNLRWWLNQGVAALRRPGEHPPGHRVALDTYERLAHDPWELFSSTLNVGALVARLGAVAPVVAGMLAAGPDGAQWDELDVVAHAGKVGAPVLSIAGWHDTFVKSGVELFTALRAGSAPGVRGEHRLIVGPWDHQSYLSWQTLSSAGVVNYGPAAAGGRPGLGPVIMAWFDRWLKDVPGDPQSAPVRYFQMGPNRWQTAAQWPPSGTQAQCWYLTSGGRANTSAGDGRLTISQPAGRGTDSYVYDPENPVPTTGGRTQMYFIPAGPQDQREVAARPDVLVYESAALLGAVVAAGPVHVKLFVSSSAPGTDFHVTLAEVHADGRVLNVADGACRISAGDVPVDGREIVIDLAHTAHTFACGHRIRPQIASSNFPRFDRNRNVGPGRAPVDYDPAVQHVLHGGATPSALILTTHPDDAGAAGAPAGTA